MTDNTQPARWYMVNKMGMATLCASKADAEKEAADAQRFWPHMGPHRAVQLVEVGTSAAELHPSPQEGMVGGWISVDERLPQPFKEVVVYPRPDDYCCEAFCDMAGNWTRAEYEQNFGVHHRECRVEYWLMLPEVPAPPTTPAGG